jgi:hypothetical protein
VEGGDCAEDDALRAAASGHDKVGLELRDLVVPFLVIVLGEEGRHDLLEALLHVDSLDVAEG